MSLRNLKRAAVALLFTLATLAMGGAFAQGAPAGVTPLNPPQPVENDGKVEVLEFFAYGCIHCANLENNLEKWVKGLPADVKFRRVPSSGLSRGIDSVAIYHTLEAMNQLDKLHKKIFDAANYENVMLGNAAALNKWLEKQGVDPKKYEETQKSFSVQARINRTRKMNEDYRISGTPTFVVNGRFVVESVNPVERLFGNLERMIEVSRPAVKAAAAPAATAAAPKKK